MKEIYTTPFSLERDLNNLDNKIKNLQEGNNNIIKHSLVEDIENEINNIENGVKATKRKSIKRTCIRNIKLFGNLARAVAPFVLIPCFMFSFLSGTVCMPFSKKDVIHYARHDMVLDSNGVNEDKVEYKAFVTGGTGRVTVAGKWMNGKNGNYYRVKQMYLFTKEDDVNKFLELRKKDNITLDDVFGSLQKPLEIETKDELTEEELNSEGYIKISYYYTDEGDSIVIPIETDGTRGCTATFIICTVLAWILALVTRYEKFDYRYFEKNKEIMNKYKNPDMKEVMKQFRVKKKEFAQMKSNNFQPILEVERNIQKTKTIK